MTTYEPIKINDGRDMYYACCGGELERMQAHGDGGGDLNLVTGIGWGGLLGAVIAAGEFPDRAERCLSVARYLLGKGADANLRTTSEGGDIPAGTTPLMLAGYYGLDEFCDALLGGRADPTLTDANQKTARQIAEEKGHQSTATLLARAEPRSAVKLPPAASDQQLALWEALRRAGGEDAPWDPALATAEACAARDFEGNRALHAAASAGSL
eukprot:COSAG02_NODE_10682_length_1884_cov_3.613445_2_plen_212_part_00